MIVAYIIISIISIINLILCSVLVTEIRRQEEKMQYLIEQNYSILAHISFSNDAEEMILWKIRQDVYNWQNMWASKEQYEDAQQAKIMIRNIEYLIENYRKNIKQHDSINN